MIVLAIPILVLGACVISTWIFVINSRMRNIYEEVRHGYVPYLEDVDILYEEYEYWREAVQSWSEFRDSWRYHWRLIADFVIWGIPG